MFESFYAYSIEMNLPTNDNVVDGEVVCHDYTVTYEYDGFSAIEESTGRKYMWQCECSFDDLTEDDHTAILDYRGIVGETEATLEDWWMSQIKMRYVGYWKTKKK